MKISGMSLAHADRAKRACKPLATNYQQFNRSGDTLLAISTTGERPGSVDTARRRTLFSRDPCKHQCRHIGIRGCPSLFKVPPREMIVSSQLATTQGPEDWKLPIGPRVS